MPGLCGFIYSSRPLQVDPALASQRFEAMLSTLSYGRCRHTASSQILSGWLGCAHLGIATGPPVHQSEDVTVVIHGYLVGNDGVASDAQCAHQLYMQYGAEFVHHLGGAFVVAVWDGRTHTLLLANDRLGLRPMYLAELHGTLRFASEVKALLSDPALPRDLDLDAIASFFHFGHIHGERTFFQAVRLLPPGCLLALQDGRLTTCFYARLSYPGPDVGHSDTWYAGQISRSLRTAVDRLIRPNLRYGVMLSGGLDSRWIAALLAHVRPDSVAFTFGDDFSDDVRVAAQVSSALNLEHHRFPLLPTYLAERAEEIVYTTDGMYNVVHAHEYPLVASLEGEVDVLMGGLLGDLLFGRNVHPLTVWMRTRGAAVSYTYRALRKGGLPSSDMEALFGPDRATQMTALARQSLVDSFAPDVARPLDLRDHQNIVQRHRRFYYQAQLLKTPYVEMAHPMCDRDVLKVGTRLPLSQRFMQRAYRRALAITFPHLASIPWTLTSLPPTSSDLAILVQRVLSRKLGKRLPDSFTESRPLLRVQRRATRYAEWLRGPLHPWLTGTLLNETGESALLLDSHAVARMVNDHVARRRDLTDSLGLLLTFKLWSRQFLEMSTPSPPPCLACKRPP